MRIRSKFLIFFFITTLISIIVMSFTIHSIINQRFEDYILENQRNRDVTIIEYFKMFYAINGEFTESAGIELTQNAQLGDFVLTLMDKNQHVLWEMDEQQLLEEHELMGHQKVKFKDFMYPIKVNNEVVGYVKIGQYGDLLFSPNDLDFKKSIWLGIVFSLLLSISISTVVALLLSKQMANSISKIKEFAYRITKGNYNNLNTEHYDTLEMESLNQSLHELAKSLEQQEYLRKELTSNVSHELRTPLNILMLELEAMMDGIHEPTKDRLQSCQDEIVRLTSLVNDLEKLTQLEQSYNLSQENIPLNSFLRKCGNLMNTTFLTKNMHLHYEFDQDVSVFIDPNKFNQVILNILSNSYKYSEQNTNVYLRTFVTDHQVVIQIMDEGIGIKKEEIPYLFERFYRTEKSRNRQYGGAGIGLSIVLEIIKKHGFDITIDSEEQKGTKVEITIPL